MARVKVSACRSTKTPLGQPNWVPGGFRWFVILMGVGVVLAAFFVGWELAR